MTSEPRAAELVVEGLSRMFDAAGVVLLTWLGWRMFFDLDGSLQDDALLVAIIGIIATAGDPRAARNIPLPMLAYVTVALLSAAVHRWRLVSTAVEPAWLSLFAPAYYLVVMAAFVYGAAYLLRTPLRLSWFAVLVMIGTFVLSAQIAFDRAVSGLANYERAGPSLASVPHWGGIHGTSLVLTIGLPLVSAGLASRKSLWRAVASTILTASLLGVAYANGSRGGLLAMGVVAGSVAFLAVLHAAHREKQAPLVAATAAVFAVIILLAVWVARGSFANGSDLSGRTLLWQAAIRLIGDHPWLGVGPGNYGQAIAESGYAKDFPSYLVGSTNAHNLLLQTSAEVGLIGGFCMLLFVAWTVRACWRAWSAGRVPMVSLAILLSMEGFMVHSMSENFLEARVAVERTRLIVWMILAASLALERLPRSRMQHSVSPS